MADYTVHTMMVSLNVEDAPLGYNPPFGPKVEVSVSYNERETVQPANLNSTNFGRQWTHNWNGWVRIDGTHIAKVALGGGGLEEHDKNRPDGYPSEVAFAPSEGVPNPLGAPTARWLEGSL